ncbi:ATP-binding protein [Micromonospora sp. NPDC023966]|uniref:sensor histidine kinase n=1 Tax=Micromonospora sp. NPDC023966 TaxID=3154699 RepID=UPI0033EBAE41
MVTELRRLLVILRGAEAVPEGLPSLRRIDPLTAGVRLAGGQVDVAVTGDLGTIPAAADVSGYRILQEALTNTARHAPGSTVRVSIEVAGDVLRLHVVDDGARPARRNTGTGHGLTGIRERAELFGGTVSVGPGPHGGFEVRVELPFDAEASAAPLSPTGVAG